MNKYLWQRLTLLTVLPLCALLTGQSRADDGNDGPDGRNGNDGRNIVNIGRDSNLPPGEQAGAVVAILGSSTSEGHAGNVVAILGNTHVTGDATGNAVAVLGGTHVDARIEGNVVAVLGDVELGPHADIGGNVVSIGGGLQRDSASIVHGSVANIFANDFGGVNWFRAWIQHCVLYGRPLAFADGLGWAWGLAFAFLALYVALALLFRDGLTRCVHTFESHPGQTVLAGLALMLLTPVLLVLLFVTVIGIAAVPFILFGLFCAGLFGKAVMLAWLGRRVTGGGSGEGALSHPAAWVLIGGLVVLALYLVPVLGFLVYKLLGLLGLGAVAYTAIVGVRAHQTAKYAARGTAGPAAAAAPAAAAENPHVAAADPAPSAAPPPASAALPRAGFWIRIAALLIDAVLVGVLLSLLNEHHLHLVVLAAYGAVMWKLRGSTVGGIVLDLSVVRSDGRPVDWETAIIRALACFLSLAVAGLGFIWIALDPHNQAWHDKIAGTLVVRVAKAAPLV